MLITNATVVTREDPNRVLPNHAVYMSGNHIVELGSTSRLEKKYPKSRTMDAHGQLLLPGGICAHTHFHRVFCRGLTWPLASDVAGTWRLRLDRALLEEDIRYSALLSLVDAIRSGTTTLFDHHASPNAVDGSLDVIADAVEASGLRAVLSYAITDADGPGVADAAIKENSRFLRKLGGGKVGRLGGMFGLQACFGLSGGTLQAARAAAPDGAGFHILAAEAASDQYDTLRKTKMRVVDRMHTHGILGPRTIAAHCVHVDAVETRLLADNATWVAHLPRSNMNMGAGAAPVESLMRAGVRVCLGTDGLSQGMWEEWKSAYVLLRSAGGDPERMSGQRVAQMAIHHGAALASMYFPAAPVGTLVPGAAADMILVDYQAPTPVTADNFDQHVIFGLQSAMVTTTIVSGKVLMKDRQLTSLDEAEIAGRGRELARRVWKRMEDNVAT